MSQQGFNHYQSANMIQLLNTQGQAYLVERGVTEFGGSVFLTHEWYAGSRGNVQASHEVLCARDDNKARRRCHIGKISVKPGAR